MHILVSGRLKYQCSPIMPQTLQWPSREPGPEQKEKTMMRCREWLEKASGRSTVLAVPEGDLQPQDQDLHGRFLCI